MRKELIAIDKTIKANKLQEAVKIMFDVAETTRNTSMICYLLEKTQTGQDLKNIIYDSDFEISIGNESNITDIEKIEDTKYYAYIRECETILIFELEKMSIEEMFGQVVCLDL